MTVIEQQDIPRKKIPAGVVNSKFIVNEDLETKVEGRERAIEQLVQELRSSLQSSQVLTPGSEGYTESIKRWSDAVEMRAVCGHLSLADRFV